MGNRKVLISLPADTLKKLDTYAKKEFQGIRSMAIYKILENFFEKEEEKKHAES